MSAKFLLRSFAGGEITPELAGRLDLTKYQTGLSLARNFITLPHGPATRRPGMDFINRCFDGSRRVRLVPFSFSADQTVVLEFGHLYIRFHINGGTLLEDAKTVSSIVGSTVTTSTAHGYTTGNWVFMGGRYHKVASTPLTTTFTTTDLWGVASTATGVSVQRVYQIVSPYDEADLFDLHYAQNSDVITITHPGYATRELARNGATDWTLTALNFAPPAAIPTGVTVTATIANNQNLSPQRYVVTAVLNDGVSESLQSATVSTNNNLSLAGNYNTVTWLPVNGAERYNVYKLRGGTFGYIGQKRAEEGPSPKTITNISRFSLLSSSKTVNVTTSTAHGFTSGNRVLILGTGIASFDGVWAITVTSATQFTYQGTLSGTASATTGTASIPILNVVDDNVQADTASPPPEDLIALNDTAGQYPAATTYHEQRRWFAGTDTQPQVVWATRTGTESNLTSSVPSRDADGLELRLAAAQNNQIRHLVPLSDLIALTAGGEFRIYAEGAPAITPTSVSIKPQGYAGANNVQPVVTSGSILYVQAQGSRVRELAYNWEANAYRSIDISIMAPHRFNGWTIDQLAYSRAPDQLLWAVRNDGTLLGLTYVPDQQVFAWHAHDTDGLIESVCVVAEGNEDVLYLVVKRTINSQTVRYIERIYGRVFNVQEDAFFVDSGLSYYGSPISSVTGLYHLEGEEVDILVDGAVHPRRTVVNGSISLDHAASVIHIGLPFTSDLRTLPLAIEGAAASGQGTAKNVNKVHVRVSQSSIVKAGPTFERLREYPARAVTDPYDSPPELRDGELTLSIDPSWNQDAAVCVRQDLPLPLTVLSMTLEVQAGG
jgi:hypothetical protein